MTSDIARFIWETELIGKCLVGLAGLFFLALAWLALELRAAPLIEDDNPELPAGAYWHAGDR